MSVVDCWVEVDTGVEDTWKIVRDFIHNDAWMLSDEEQFQVDDQSQENVVRTYSTQHGEITERLISVDDFDYVVRYDIQKSFLPLKKNRVSLSVTDNHDGTTSVFWRVEFDPEDGHAEEVTQFFEEWFQQGLDRLQNQLAY